MPERRTPERRTPEHRTEVTAGGIARLAGVGRAAVSNWRRRHADFPKPVGGTDTSPTFDLGETEQWLRDQGKLTRVPLRERVWQQVEQDPAGAAAALRRIGAVLLLVRDRPTVWAGLASATDQNLASGLPDALADVLRERLGDDHPVPVPTADEASACLPLLRGGAELGGGLGPRQAFEFLMSRHMESGARQYTLTPAEPAELMAELAGPAGRVLDPACGFGGLLRAAGPSAAVSGQELDPDLAALTALRLALHTDGPVRVRVGDSLRADAFPGLGADAVLCHPPFNERAWGHDELAYDARWEYGFPPRTESELAWVQHALAHAREGGSVVLLMPPAAASRRSGRRIRADLLRRGALRAVIALPAGAAPPFGIPLHLWVLRRPGAGSPPPQQLLLVDAGDLGGGEKLPWQAVRTAVLEAWRAFDQDGAVPQRPGLSRTLQVIDLLDDDVDLAPARHLAPPVVGGGATGLTEVRDRLTSTLRRTAELAPAAGSRGEPAHWPLTSVGELARAGALVMRAGGAGAIAGSGGTGDRGGTGGDGGTSDGGSSTAVLTEHDVVAGSGPSGVLPEGADEEPVLTRIGDVVVPVLGRGAVARLVDEATAGAALGRNVYLLRPDPAALDPWFLAGFLRGTANNRQASSYTTSSTRLDVRRLQVPRLPLADQRRYGERFRTLAAFEEALRLTGRLGEQLVQGLYDGLTDGSVDPE
ncbi:SAM-dependent methyltransferase [Streptacidiphilus sp. MAP12-16]|uniref:N-6 DNA methylase n=1 Tax=Streptacidiphilus sp. MAP12-16 TaxID=3156300 RepID=UPI00351175A1